VRSRFDADWESNRRPIHSQDGRRRSENGKLVSQAAPAEQLADRLFDDVRFYQRTRVPGCLQSACWILRPASRNAITAYFLRQHMARLSFLVGPLDRIVRVSGAVALHSQPMKAVARLCLVKTPKGRERLESFAPPPYRRGHDHDSFHRRFHTRLPASSPRLLGTRAHRAATSGECPAVAGVPHG
jgi:hypothetical protein